MYILYKFLFAAVTNSKRICYGKRFVESISNLGMLTVERCEIIPIIITKSVFLLVTLENNQTDFCEV